MKVSAFSFGLVVNAVFSVLLCAGSNPGIFRYLKNLFLERHTDLLIWCIIMVTKWESQVTCHLMCVPKVNTRGDHPTSLP